MRVRRLLSLFLIVVISTAICATELDLRQGLQEILPRFSSAWNKGEVSGFITLFHPDSRLRKLYSADPKMKNYIDTHFAQMFSLFGKVTRSAIHQYIDKKYSFVVRVTYENKGVVPGTFAVKKFKGEWLIYDFNPDGQMEPQLQE